MNREQRRAAGQRGPVDLPKAGGAIDLSALKQRGSDGLTAVQLQESAIMMGEMHSGYRCAGCKERINVGFKFTRWRVEQTPDGPTILEEPTFACSRPECGYASHVAGQATVMERVEYVWTEDLPLTDAPAPEASAG